MKMIPISCTDKFALVDDEDYERLAKFIWHLRSQCGIDYAQRNVRRNGLKTTRQMHQDILRAPPGTTPDHIDGNGLNNQRENLRPATAQQNARNRRVRSDSMTKIKGVTRDKTRWRAYICIDGLNMHLGSFGSIEEAAACRAAASERYFGNYARKGHP